MSAFRPLPPRPSLEYEHKEAKALLRRLRARDPESIQRARTRHPDIPGSERVQLADAQLVIAREYGFASWPKLVRYFEDVERQKFVYRSSRPPSFWEMWPKTMRAEFADRRVWVARALVAYVPRFYGLRVDDVFSAAPDENEFRLATARMSGFPSWEVALAHPERREDAWDEEPMREASRVMKSADLDGLKRVVEMHPQLLHPTDDDVVKNYTLFSQALWAAEKSGAQALAPIMDWLTDQGLDRQRELNMRLCGHVGMSVDEVTRLLEWGADPSWVAPNGIPVLEHALLRYRNGDAVDMLAARTRPREAFWISAGLGNVAGVRRYLDSNGKPTAAARQHRPPFDAVGPVAAAHPEPDDEEILFEAFVVAILNGRVSVLDYMLSRGFPVNTLIWGCPLIVMAVGDRMTGVVASLIRGGANLDLRGWRPQQSAREVAREMLENNPNDAEYRRLAEMCGLNPATVLAERNARPLPQPRTVPALESALAYAGDDAFRAGQAEIRPENLFYGLLRGGGLPMVVMTSTVQREADRFRADVRARVRPDEPSPERPKLVLDANAQEAIRVATATAAEKRSEIVQQVHLLFALTLAESGPVADILARYGISATTVNAELREKWV